MRQYVQFYYFKSFPLGMEWKVIFSHLSYLNIAPLSILILNKRQHFPHFHRTHFEMKVLMTRIMIGIKKMTENNRMRWMEATTIVSAP